MALIHDHAAVMRLFALHRLTAAAVAVVLLRDRPLMAAGSGLLGLVAAGLIGKAARPLAARGPGARQLLLPWILWLAAWVEVGWLFRVAVRLPHDAVVAAADLALFGGPWHQRLGEVMPGAFAGEFWQAAYLSYYGLILGPPIALVLAGRRADAARYTRAVLTTYLLCFTLSLVWPVCGPFDMAARDPGLPGEAPTGLAGVADLLRRTGDSPGTAFPSSHCAGSVAAALAAGAAYGTRRSRLLLLTWAALIVISTIHTGNHYAIDAAAGVLTAVGVRGALARSFALRMAVPGRGLT
jgi:membrane-associated phospholipid phosphatase